MSDYDDGRPRPRHRKNGRASKRGSHRPGRHLRSVPTTEPAQDRLGTYPVDDVAAMSASAAEMLLHRARLEQLAGAPACPHLLITRDSETGAITRSEPFGSGLEALTSATAFVEKYRHLQPRWEFTLTVVPLLPE